MKSFYGFTKPYNFKRAFPFVTAIFFLFLIIGIGVVYFSKHDWGTYRFAYFVYIGSIALTAAAVSFAPRCAWLLISLFFIEFSLGVGTSVLAKMYIVSQSTMLPQDIRLNEPPRFRFHPLLQGTPTPNFLRLLPFEIQHDSYGLRGAERDKDRLKQQIVIATIGASTTYDVGVANGQTWSDALERKLGDEYAVLNHGVPGHSTVENLIQTLFYLNSYDVRPQCAVYYLGWADIRNAHLPNLDPAFADFHLLSQSQNLKTRKTPLLARISPLGRIVIRYSQAWLETIQMPENFFSRPAEGGSDMRLEKIFRANLEAIAAINKQRGITSIFVGQVLNRAKLRDTTRYGWFPLVPDIEVWPLQAHFNTILKDTAEALGSPELVPPIDEFQDADFVDNGHFSPEGAEKFAVMLTPIVRAKCKKK